MFYFFLFKQKTAYEMRISDWSSDVCSSDLMRRNDLAIFLHAAERQTQHLQEHHHRQRLGDRGHEVAFAVGLDLVDQLASEFADAVLEAVDGFRREHALQRCA